LAISLVLWAPERGRGRPRKGSGEAALEAGIDKYNGVMSVARACLILNVAGYRIGAE
jgi:hypothetical protein